MPMKICFELSDRDLRYFRRMMQQVRVRGREIDETELLGNARAMVDEIRNYSRATDFLLTRLTRLERLMAMLADDQWRMRGKDRLRVVEGLTYFTEGEDLVPDRIPGLGFLDDAIMIELVVQELQHEIDAYEDFVAYRAANQHRPASRRAPRNTPLQPRQDQLLSRMRRRIRRDRARRRANGGASGSVL